MRGKFMLAGLILTLGAAVTPAQSLSAPSVDTLQCSGLVTSESVPQSTFVITGEEANGTLSYVAGNIVYVNKGSRQGVTVGQKLSVVRPAIDPVEVEWTKWQNSIFQKMGTLWEDEGRLSVIIVRPDVSIARVENSCNPIQRGDIVLPFMERPAPPLKSPAQFDRFAPPNGKRLAMAIIAKNFAEAASVNDVVYVNVGAQQGIKVGDYFRFFRYTGQHNESSQFEPRFAFDVDKNLGPTYGFGGVSKNYNWSNVPREDVGEGVVLRTGPNSSTVIITYSVRTIFMGDYVELE